MAVEYLLRVLHIVPAIFLAGGIFFMWAALVPALGTVPDETRDTVFAAVRGRWAKVVMACTGLLLITGIVNAVRAIIAYDFSGTPGQMYHGLVALKLLLALGIFFITAVIGGRSSMAERFRQKLGFWMGVNTLLLIVLLLVASAMKISERTPKAEDAIQSNVAAPQQPLNL